MQMLLTLFDKNVLQNLIQKIDNQLFILCIILDLAESKKPDNMFRWNSTVKSHGAVSGFLDSFQDLGL